MKWSASLWVTVYAGLIGATWQRSHIRIDLFEGVFGHYPAYDRIHESGVWVLGAVFFIMLAVFMSRQIGQLLRWEETFLFLLLVTWWPLAVFAALNVVSLVFGPYYKFVPQEELGE